MPSLTDRMRLLQFGDSVLPVGSFSFSNGVEAAIQQGVVHDVATLQDFVGVAILQAATSDGIALLEAHRAFRAGDISRIVGADNAVFIRKLNEEMRTMTTRMGRKLGEMAAHILHTPLIEEWLGHVQRHQAPGTYPVALGQLFAALHQPEEHAFAAHQYGVATMMLSAALRLMKLNYLDSQSILFALNETAEEDYQRASLASLEDMATFAPSVDVLAAIHVRSHVRMFMN